MSEPRRKSLSNRLLKELKEKIAPGTVGSINMNEYKQELLSKGVAGVKEKLRRELDNWTTIALNTAVVGNSGTGKSSFINAIRGLKAKQAGAAKVGVNETTFECQPYKHPDNKRFVVWDLPGVGTPKFPKEDYLRAVEYDKYDFFIIMSKSRFTENDLWLALEVQKRNKTFFFVRSNIDKDIADNKEDDPDNHDERQLLQTIREETEKELNGNGIKVPKVFLINNRKKDTFDFGKLNNELLSSCDGLKKDSMALSIAALTKEIMAEKQRVLRDRIPKIALDVASCSGKDQQIHRFQLEILYYQKQFDIDDDTIAENKDIWTLSDENVKEFQVAFDQYGLDGEINVETPTAMRARAGIWKRFADNFSWSKEKKLLYAYCELSLTKNLDVLYEKACSLHDLQRTKQLVHSVKK